jgi:hypothetical protein
MGNKALFSGCWQYDCRVIRQGHFTLSGTALPGPGQLDCDMMIDWVAR